MCIRDRENIKYTQNKLLWMKAALGIMTTDTQPKMAMEECYIGKNKVKIYKGLGQNFLFDLIRFLFFYHQICIELRLCLDQLPAENLNQ